ncbi:MAG: DUF1295 domain-containing protein [Caldithrix sp.]|nr:DUF1295 domain-containing protein [Caldithrix sp.]
MQIHGEHKASVSEKLFLSLNHLIVVIIVTWLLFGGGFQQVSSVLGMPFEAGDIARRTLLLIASLVYFVRLIFTGYFMTRKMSWVESITVAIWLYSLHLVFAFFGGQNHESIGPVAVFGSLLYVTGSYLNTAAEYQRFRWNRRAENNGKLYTTGLFGYSRHMNYFGDTVLFAGFALITGVWYSLIIPVAMAAMFIFYHIPKLEAHLREKYPDAFAEYTEKTAQFVPWLF